MELMYEYLIERNTKKLTFEDETLIPYLNKNRGLLIFFRVSYRVKGETSQNKLPPDLFPDCKAKKMSFKI